MLKHIRKMPWGGKYSFSLYSCHCGRETVKREDFVNSGHTKSCGCLKTKHGLIRHPLYARWSAMKERCFSPTCCNYPNYGARGIKVCEEWIDNPATFIEWALGNGWKKELQIDRIDNDGDYEPSNCRFVTRHENMQNSRNAKITVSQVREIRELFSNGILQSEIAMHYGINDGTVSRICSNKSWSNIV